MRGEWWERDLAMTAVASADGVLPLCHAPFYPEQVLAHLILIKFYTVVTLITSILQKRILW